MHYSVWSNHLFPVFRVKYSLFSLQDKELGFGVDRSIICTEAVHVIINELIRCDLTITVPDTSFNDLSPNITWLNTRFINMCF